MKEKSDEDLMVLIRKGKEEAFSELYKRFKNKLLRFFYRMLNNDEDKAQDFLQDLFIRIIEKPEKFNPKQKFSTWIYTVAANMCKNEFRNLQNRESILNDIGYNNDITFNELDSIDRKYFEKEFNTIFKQLNADQQLLITLRFQQELTVKEIAGIINIAEGTVKSRLFYLMKNLSEKLKEFKPIL